MSIQAPAFAGARAHRRYAFSGSLGLTPIAAQRVFQRDQRSGGAFGLGQGAVPLALQPTQPVSLLEYQVRDAANPAAILVPWTGTGTTLAAGAPQSVSVPVPARAGWTVIDLRANGEFGSIVTTSRFGVGEVIAASGQSLASDFWGTTESGDTTTLAALGCIPSPFSSCLAGWDGLTSGSGALPAAGQAWTTPADGSACTSAFAAELLRLVVAATGVNAALVGYAWTGQPIGQWAAVNNPANPNVWTNLVSVLAQVQKFGTFIWCHGHNDARNPATGINGQLTPPATYVAALQTLMASLAAQYPAMPFARLLSSIPSIGSVWSAKYPANWIEAIRGAHQTYVAADPLAQEVDGLDVVLAAADTTHPSQAGNLTYARHFYRALMGTIAPARFPSGDRGPVLQGSASRAKGSAVVVLPVTQAGGNALVCPGGAPASQFQVFPSGATNGALPVASVDLSNPSQIAITLASTPADTQALDVWYRLPYDSTAAIGSGIYDNDATDNDGLTVGRQLMLTNAAAAITAAAPAAAIIAGTATQQGQAAAFSYNLAAASAYAVLNTAGTDEGTRQPITGPGGTVSLTPQAYGPYQALIYAAAAGGSPIAATAAFTVAQAAALPALASPVVWFDASCPSSVFADAGRSGFQTTNFGPVQGLADLSGNGFHVQQATLAKAPQLILARRNGHPGLRFQGASGQFLQSLAAASWMQAYMNGPLTVLAVFELVSDANSNTPHVPVSLAYSGNATGSNSFNVQASTTGTPWVGAARNPVGGFGSSKDTNAAVAQKNLLLKVAGSFSASAATMSVVVNADTSVAPRTGITGSLSQAGSLWDTLMLGGEPGSPAFAFDGYIYEIGIWAAAATSAQLQSLVSYTTTKWGS